MDDVKNEIMKKRSEAKVQSYHRHQFNKGIQGIGRSGDFNEKLLT